MRRTIPAQSHGDLHVTSTVRRRERGLTIMDLLLAVGLAALALSVLMPQKRLGRILKSERRLSQRLTELGLALQTARIAKVRDLDGDGVGEYPPLGALAPGAVADLEAVPGTGTHHIPGWYIELLLPDRRFQPVSAGDPDVSVDAAEVACLLIAWPESPGESGMRAYCWTPADGLLKHTVDGYPYGGADDPPSPRRALVERVGTDLSAAHLAGPADSRWVHPQAAPRDE